MRTESYPLTFRPVFKDYPWGGRNLATRLGRELPDGIIAESWEIAAHPNGASTVANGPLAGLALPEVQARWGIDLVGMRNSDALARGRFPLLVKLLDANQWLSVQVHPHDGYAQEHDGEFGKTEMWVVLYAEPGAELVYGFETKTDRATFAQMVTANETGAALHHVPVEAGDVIFVPAGAIHALGPGIIIAEIQQNSDATYRIYDWGRPRPLHIDKALDVLDWSLVRPEPYTPVRLEADGYTRELIGECEYFRTERMRLDAARTLPGRCDGSTYEVWGVLQGEAELGWRGEPVRLDAVSWALLPAALGEFEVRAGAGSELLRVITPAGGA
jgi:mannose-6-phosphate isomerase